MQLGPVRVTIRLVAIAASVALAVYVAAIWLLGPAWGLLLLGLAVAAVGAATVLLGLGLRHRLNTLLNELRQSRVRRPVEQEQVAGAVSPSASEEVAALRSEIEAADDATFQRLRTLDRAQRRDRLWETFRSAEERRSRDAEVALVPRQHEYDLLAASPLFDASHYREREPDAGPDPVGHYLDVGAVRGVDPHPLFCGWWYVERYPEALDRWRTPLGHFLAEGAASGADPHPIFRSRWYAERYLENRPHEVPVLHYLGEGRGSDHDPNPLFSTAWYREQHAAWLAPDDDPLLHYLTEGAELDLDPSPEFSTSEARRRGGALTLDPLSAFLDAWPLPQASPRALAVREADRQDPRRLEAALRWELLLRDGLHETDTFALYRIIGNDLPPRHRRGQSLDNLRFMLEHEPELPGCERWWVLNRIRDPEVEEEMVALIEAHGRRFLRIAFDPEEYRQVPWRFDGLEPPGLLYRREFEALDHKTQQRVLDHVYHHKNLYVMNNNGARNVALRHGRERARWVLPWDGNCFLTRAAWEELVDYVRTHRHFKYVIVPMARVTENAQLLDPAARPPAEEEPQILFRRDALEEFDERARYGRRPKVEFFYRLGIPGPWDGWHHDPWDDLPEQLSPEAGQYGQASWVARLFSGEQKLEGDIKDRGMRRVEAVRQAIDVVDEQVTREVFDTRRLFAMDEDLLADQRDAWRDGDPDLGRVIADLEERAKATLGGPVYTVTAKTTVAPSGDPHDYWHPAPYWWPDPNRRRGLPYVKRDGERVPGTRLWEPGSEKYDRSALQSMIDETYLCALAGWFTGEEDYLQRGAELLRGWFLDPATRMNPHLRYAQVRRGHNNDEGTNFGIIESKDLAYLLDAVRFLERDGVWVGTEADELRAWLAEFRVWLRDGSQGRDERASLNNHGTWYDVQVAAIDAYLDDVPELLSTFRRAQARITQQFASDGSQPEELDRTITQHYVCFNLQGWVTLAGMADRIGQDLWNHRDHAGRGVRPAVDWLMARVGRPWPFPQSEPFDEQRPLATAHLVADRIDGVRLPSTLPPRTELKRVFDVHDGIRPFWLVGA